MKEGIGIKHDWHADTIRRKTEVNEKINKRKVLASESPESTAPSLQTSNQLLSSPN